MKKHKVFREWFYLLNYLPTLDVSAFRHPSRAYELLNETKKKRWVTFLKVGPQRMILFTELFANFKRFGF